MDNYNSRSQVTRKIIQTALLIGLSLALRSVSTMVSFLGAPGMRMGFSPIFTRMPALLFGPLYGGIAGGIVDVLGYLIKPEGPYIPLLTLTSVLDGIIAGFIWKILKNADSRRIQSGLWITFISIGTIGVLNLINTRFFPNSRISILLDNMGNKKDFLVLGLVVTALIGLLLLTIDFFIRAKFPQASVHKYYLKNLLAFGTAGLTITVLNTFILRLFFPALGKLGFFTFLIPRVLEEFLMSIILSYISAFLLSVFYRMVADKPS